MDRIIPSNERTILRSLASEVAEIASRPEIDIRRQYWFQHNSLQIKRPMLLIFPEGSWVELLPESVLHCQGEFARSIELELRKRIYTFQHFQDDSVIEAEWMEPPVMNDNDWGVEITRHAATQARGSWSFIPVIRTEEDLQKLHFPDLIYDEAQSQRNASQMDDLFGDILRVKAAGIQHLSFHLMQEFTNLCGLEEMLTDMIDRPDFVHHVLSFLTEGHLRLIDQYMDANLFNLNNNNTYHSSGGNGYTHELPAPGFDPLHVRPSDMWSSAESQEFAVVSPRMHAEFALHYEKQLLAHFGLNGYGCCEDLSRKLDDVLTIPNLRRVSISPFASVDRSAPKLKDKVIFSWKTHPAHLVGEFNETMIEGYLQHTLDLAKEHSCVLEMILKDTHTCEFHPERFDRWTQIARELIIKSGWN